MNTDLTEDHTSYIIPQPSNIFLLPSYIVPPRSLQIQLFFYDYFSSEVVKQEYRECI